MFTSPAAVRSALLVIVGLAGSTGCRSSPSAPPAPAAVSSAAASSAAASSAAASSAAAPSAAAPPSAPRSVELPGAPPAPFEVRALRSTRLFGDPAGAQPLADGASSMAAGSLLTVLEPAGTVRDGNGLPGPLVPVRRAAADAPAFALWTDLEVVQPAEVLADADAAAGLLHAIDRSRRGQCPQRVRRLQLPAAGGGFSQRYLVYTAAGDESCSGLMAILAGTLGREVVAWTRRPGPILDVTVHPAPGEPPLFEVVEAVAPSALRAGRLRVLLSGGRPELRALLAADAAVEERGPGSKAVRSATLQLAAAPAGEPGLLVSLLTTRIETDLDGGHERGRTRSEQRFRYRAGALTPLR